MKEELVAQIKQEGTPELVKLLKSIDELPPGSVFYKGDDVYYYFKNYRDFENFHNEIEQEKEESFFDFINRIINSEKHA